MPAVLGNLVRVATATTGTGTVTLGSALPGALTFAGAGIPNGSTVSYSIAEGANTEVGRGVYSTTGPTLTRSVLVSTNSNNPINLTGTATVIVTALAEDFVSGLDDLDDVALTSAGQQDRLRHNGSGFVNAPPILRSALGNVTGTGTIDLNAGEFFTATSTGATAWTFSNVRGDAAGFVLRLTNGGAAAQTWPVSVDWPGGTAPTLIASGVDVLVFVTDDAGTTWRGALAMGDSK